MISYPRSKRALESNRLSYAINSADRETKAEHDTKMVAAHSPAIDSVVSRELTLDDFGGRSDALGG